MQKKRILVVEDNKDMSTLLRKRLEKKGFSVDTVEDGRSLLSHLQVDKEPDAVVLDLMIPETSGIELLNGIKCTWTGARIFVFSALPESNARNLVRYHDICGFFKKTDGINKLIAAIEKELNG